MSKVGPNSQWITQPFPHHETPMTKSVLLYPYTNKRISSAYIQAAKSMRWNGLE